MKRINYVLIGAGCLLISPLTSSAKAQYTHCPTAKKVHYVSSNRRFEAVSTDGTIWRTSEVATLTPVPTIEFIKMTAAGKQDNFQIACSYKLGNNTFALSSVEKFKLKPSSKFAVTYKAYGFSQMSCASGKTCQFSKVVS